MKKLFLYTFLFVVMIFVVLLSIMPDTTRAQTFGGGILVNGVSNLPAVNGLIPITNTFFVTLPAKTVNVTGISSTNEIFTGTFYLQLVGYTNATAGLTNFLFLGAFTNSFALPGGTNGGTWSTNYPGGFVSIPFPLWMGANTGATTNTNTVYVP